MEAWMFFVTAFAASLYVWRKSLRGMFVSQINLLCSELLKYDAVFVTASRIAGLGSVTIETGSHVKWFEFLLASGKVSVPLPYDRRMKSRRIFLVYGDERREINYPRGVPFICTPAQIGCDEIVIDYEDGVTEKIIL